MAPLLIDKDGVRVVIQSREHLPPHIHASSGEDEALINIRTGEAIEGYLDRTKLRIVQDWLAEDGHRETVEEIFFELNPRHRPKKETESQIVKKQLKKRKGGKHNEK